MNFLQLGLLLFGIVTVMGLAYAAFSGPSAAKEGARRLQNVRYRHSESTVDKVESQLKKAIAARRPKMHRVAGSTSRLDALALRLHRSGKSWTITQYLYASVGIALTVTVLIFLKSGALLLALGIGILLGAGIPHLAVNYSISKRTNAFNARFPDAIELLVRGLRSGLPVTETLTVVASEIPGPVGEEFRAIVDRIKVGRSMEEALQVTADRLGTPEFQFFCITLAIQRETGGNLAETLSNLADVLRKRAQMKLKIRAMSSESKASAYIVGALPFMVFGMIYWANPKYLSAFFVDDRLIVAGIGGFIWMGIGVLVMAKMVSFEI
ncbi:type II secretion system F family protein [Altererythrobacter sp. CC-YST694]|uniref:type II secretion system F family protein n=1 Tax=Altererythrobacter sp. CC-YST694 TaxID=2755038 RepID=UPI001D02CECE|nr:type II secretion system F family protein [Altererythrobacter sp. CC-YST694]MCB5426236.1 type II secretion system F family protein [Altererythrobacter sp. CC-YST694]